ncbi:MAG: N(4)-(beta-N-acetylglucosaminyl)-L-asparaginase [Tepidisphaerales bacterium]
MSSTLAPLLLSTWSFGRRANAAGWSVMANGGAALDAVEAACRDAEADPENPTVGVGGLPDSSGRVSLDAAVMLSPSRRGAVAAVRRHPHPITIARRVMERTPHVLLVGPDADDFADQELLPPALLLSQRSKAAWERWLKDNVARTGHPFAATMANIEELGYGRGESLAVGEANHDTIGVLARDGTGGLAGGCTTSGLAFKLPGRVGDSPIIGHGLYVDPDVGAAVATGHGELVMSVCGAFLAVEQLRAGKTPLDAAQAVLERIAHHHSLTPSDQVGIIVLAARGEWACASLREGFRVAVKTADRDELVAPHRVLMSP